MEPRPGGVPYNGTRQEATHPPRPSRQADDAVSAAEAGLARAASDFQRRKDLLAQNVVSKSEYDAAEAQYRIAKAEQAKAIQAREEARVGLTYAAIKAPISGKVVDRLAEPGEFTRRAFLNGRIDLAPL